MKISQLILCFVAMATMLFAGCTKDDNGGNNNGGNSGSSTNSALKGTTWQLDNPHDEDYAQLGDYHVIYTVAFGQNNEVTFTRDINCEELDFHQKPVMTGTYTYGNDGKGVAMIHNEGETTDFRITFTVSGDTLVWHFNLRDITLHKQ